MHTQTQNLFQPGAKLEWHALGENAQLPFAVMRAHTVTMGNKVYVGGGETKGERYDHMVLGYDCDEQVWTVLPVCPVRRFGLTKLQEQLVIVGGERKDSNEKSDMVYSYKTDTCKWEELIPRMTSARSCVTAVGYESNLFVFGGIDEDGNCTSCVEVFRPSSNQWHSCMPIPKPLCRMSSVVIGKHCYFLGGSTSGSGSGSESKDCFKVSLELLFLSSERSSFDEEEEDGAVSPWVSLASLPHQWGCMAANGDCLATFGGMYLYGNPSFYVYSEATSSNWVRAGDLPNEEGYLFPVVAELPSPGDVLLVGGGAPGGFFGSSLPSIAVYRGNLVM